MDVSAAAERVVAAACWVPPLMDAMVNLAGASLPSADSYLDMDAGRMYNPDFVQRHLLGWADAVNSSLVCLQSVCADITKHNLSLADRGEFYKGMAAVRQHNKR